MIQEFRLIDSGKEDKTPTWRRPNRPGTKSRLDYILHSDCMRGKKAEVGLESARSCPGNSYSTGRKGVAQKKGIQGLGAHTARIHRSSTKHN